MTLPPLAGLWIVDASFKNLAVASSATGALEVSTTAKLPKAGTYYVVFRHTSTKPVLNRVTLEKGGVADIGLTPSQIISPDADVPARASFPGRAGDRFRIMLQARTAPRHPRRRASRGARRNSSLSVWPITS